jgi:hypothetical protein
MVLKSATRPMHYRQYLRCWYLRNTKRFAGEELFNQQLRKKTWCLAMEENMNSPIAR